MTDLEHIVEKRVVTAQLLQVAEMMLFLAKEKERLEKKLKELEGGQGEKTA
tara:strand:- start:500 stop:652 length:153 start_codon:yes stop_codon:yes gene_type:complete